MLLVGRARFGQVQRPADGVHEFEKLQELPVPVVPLIPDDHRVAAHPGDEQIWSRCHTCQRGSSGPGWPTRVRQAQGRGCPVSDGRLLIRRTRASSRSRRKAREIADLLDELRLSIDFQVWTKYGSRPDNPTLAHRRDFAFHFQDVATTHASVRPSPTRSVTEDTTSQASRRSPTAPASKYGLGPEPDVLNTAALALLILFSGKKLSY